MRRLADVVLKYILEHILPSLLCVGLRSIDIYLGGWSQIRLYLRKGRPFNCLGRRDTFRVVFRVWARRSRHLCSFSVCEKVDLTRLMLDQVLTIEPLQLLCAQKRWTPE